jgi:microcystin-dependent protein
MKKIFILVSLTCSLFAHSQAPQGINYQAVIRNSNGTSVSNSNVGLQFRIVQGSTIETTVYKEKFTVLSTNLGIVNVVLGQGTPLSGTFSSINWANGPFFLEVAADATGGSNYSVLGIQQMASVPYALYAEKSGTPGAQGPQGIQGLPGANGLDGKNTITKTSIETIGSNCGTGGVKIEFGLDVNNNGTLDINEINALLTKYICNGATGTIGQQGPIGATGPAGANGNNGNNGVDGKNSLVKTTNEASGINCSTGGVKLEYGIDANNNGTLDINEINALLTKYICNGATGTIGQQGAIGLTGPTGANGNNGTNGVDGKNSLVKTTNEASGINCSTGGVKLEYGIDANNNGTLDINEINALLTKYICNGATGNIGQQGPIGSTGPAGANGNNGNNGVDGKNSLVKTTNEASGINCSTGGVKLEYGLDANNNSVLDALEINATLTKFVCNGVVGSTGANGSQGAQGIQGQSGSNGTNGLNALIKTTLENTGTNCANGGTKIETGLDANGNGTLDAGEVSVSLTTYVCNSSSGSGSSGVPSGSIMAFAGATVPSGWLLCDGSIISRTTYSDMFSSIGTAWGQGDGSTTFHLPDLRGRFLRGVDGNASVDPDASSRTSLYLGGNTGNNIGSYQNDEFKSHNHNYSGWYGPFGNPAIGSGGNGNTTTISIQSSNSGGSETRPKNAYVIYIIKL